MHTDTKQEREAREVASWRCDQLLDADFALPLGLRVAHDPHYDLHALIELTDRGCPPQLAVRILAPLGEQRTA